MNTKIVVDYLYLAQSIPASTTIPSEISKRKKIFDSLDNYHYGVLEPKQCYQGLIEYLRCKDQIDLSEYFDYAFKTCSSAASNMKYHVKQNKRSNINLDDQIDRNEFRLILVQLRMIFEMLEFYRKVDVDAKGWMDEDQFYVQHSQLLSWGINDNYQFYFKKFKKNGKIKFIEVSNQMILELLKEEESEIV